MDILVITDRFPRLSQTFVINHVADLIDAGHDVRVISRRTEREEKVHPRFFEYDMERLVWYYDLSPNRFKRIAQIPTDAWKSERGLSSLKDLNPFRYGPGVLTLQTFFRDKDLPKRNFDLIHCHYGTVAWACLPLRDYYKAPLVTTFHGSFQKRFYSIGRLIYHHLFTRGDAFIANSEFTKRRIEQIGCASDKIEVIPFRPPDRERKRTREILSEKPVSVLSVARLDEPKGLQYAIQAIRILLDQGYDVRYRIAGDGPYRGALERLIAHQGLGEHVELLGWKDQAEIDQFYSESDIFILPSIVGRDGAQETQGIVILEAHQFGLATIGSDVGGIPEQVDGGKAGQVFRAGHPADLAEKIRRYIDEPDFAREMVAAAQRLLDGKYNKQGLEKQLLLLYDKVLSQSTF